MDSVDLSSLKPLITQLYAEVLLLAPRLAAALAVFLAFWIGANIARRILGRIGEHTADLGRQDAFKLLAQSLKATLIVVGAVSALGTLGINVTAMVAGLGLTGFALGFALKDALSNLLAGVLILLYHPFKRGDRITVAGFEGIVVGIDLRYTVLQAERRQILIPNSVLFTNTITLQQLEVPADGKPLRPPTGTDSGAAS